MLNLSIFLINIGLVFSVITKEKANLLIRPSERLKNSYNIKLSKENTPTINKFYSLDNTQEGRLFIYSKKDYAQCITLTVLGKNGFIAHNQLYNHEPLEISIPKESFKPGTIFIRIENSHIMKGYDNGEKYLKLILH
jgi:hypothetical protein